eukprot:CAMPEP_0183346152 /NCGR_PEP_ID=MMETSP0164_2-20130417/11354_1 /TAXON_ID=221442 /ORGANISM="Coccolithus pelagicus ssp braarudi, Strain PLY182g" /LENGTH=133 /DNA_ID=CAMNT_0025517379 /DNA_START=754 /DNA_END=1155 /DNA_ORIENTATION=+
MLEASSWNTHHLLGSTDSVVTLLLCFEQSPSANGYLFRGGVLDDLGTQVGTPNRSQIFLIRFLIRNVLEKNVGDTGLDLRLDDRMPDVVRSDPLVLYVQLLEFGSKRRVQAHCIVGTEKGPFLVHRIVPIRIT